MVPKISGRSTGVESICHPAGPQPPLLLLLLITLLMGCTVAVCRFGAALPLLCFVWSRNEIIYEGSKKTLQLSSNIYLHSAFFLFPSPLFNRSETTQLFTNLGEKKLRIKISSWLKHVCLERLPENYFQNDEKKGKLEWK